VAFSYERGTPEGLSVEEFRFQATRVLSPHLEGVSIPGGKFDGFGAKVHACHFVEAAWILGFRAYRLAFSI